MADLLPSSVAAKIHEHQTINLFAPEEACVNSL